MRLGFLFCALALLTACSMENETAHPDRTRWDERYGGEEYALGVEPAAFLKENLGKLGTGHALDIAAGEGRNAVFLAQHGFTVDAVDISPVGLRKAEALAKKRGVKIKTVEANLEDYELGAARYELVVNFYYLQRDLSPKIKRALKPGGLVVFETYNVNHKSMSRDYLLELGELKEMFAGYEILHYSEEGAVSSLIARKPK
ncbi:MAG: class I SAM-dependent methyltransferase [Elusimicrobiota bacterium]